MSHSSELEPKNVVVFGDSNTWGFNFDQFSRFLHHQRWTIRTQKALNASHPGQFHLVAEGLNGRTTMHDRQLDFEGPHNLNGRLQMPAILHSHKPLDLIVIALGTNDIALPCGPADEAVHRVLTGVRQLLQDVRGILPVIGRNGKAKILVLGLPPLAANQVNASFGFPSNLTEIRHEINEKLSGLCEKEDVNFLNIAPVLKLSAQDGIHFNEDDQVALSDLITPRIVELLA